MRAALLATASGLVLAAIPGGYLARGLLAGDRSALTPGAASPGHALMDHACDECHLPSSGDVQPGCVRCHAAALTAEEDTHAASRFDDPARAGDLARLDVRRCATCHREHRPRFTDAQSVTVPADFCVVCHQDVLTDRPTHVGLAAGGCAAVGCHRYHDNRSIYPDRLRAHVDDPDRLVQGHAPVRARPAGRPEPDLATVTASLAIIPDAPADDRATHGATAGWLASAHARGGVGCGACHQPAGAGPWVARPAAGSCAHCHAAEQASFSLGKHGMRPALGLPALRPEDARLPMKASARGRQLGCTSCHRDHAFELRAAAVEACEGCHDDGHTRAYRASAHFALWRREAQGELPPGSGVSCATCHLPRAAAAGAPGGIRVDHDQNRTLRPRDKMARAVCEDCHGLPFTLAALADDQLVERNFSGRPGAVRTGFDLLAAAKTPPTNRNGDSPTTTNKEP
jgi:hypothetical protein